MSIKWSKI